MVTALPGPGLETVETYVIGGSNAPASGIAYQVTFRTIMTLHWCGGSIINSK